MPSKAGAVSINTNRGGFGDVIEKSQICFLLSEALAGPCYRITFTADGLNQGMRINSIYPEPISQITIGQCTLVTEIAFGSLFTVGHFAARWSLKRFLSEMQEVSQESAYLLRYLRRFSCNYEPFRIVFKAAFFWRKSHLAIVPWLTHTGDPL
jgi:hypothetical protein